MADHLHKQIRSAVVTALTGLSTSASRVFPNRLHPFDSGSLPGLRVTTSDDTVIAETVHSPTMQSRSLGVEVECVATASTALDDTCDLMAKEVETALASGITVAGHHLDVVLTSSSYDDEAAGTPAGARRLSFSVGYFCLNTQPDTLA